MEDDILRIGQDLGNDPPLAFELVLSDFLTFVDPKDYDVADEGIDPAAYFITSGDAVAKTVVLEKDYWKLAGELRKQSYQMIAEENDCTYAKAQDLYREGVRPTKNPKFKEYESLIWLAAGSSRRLLNALRKAKGENIFLETEWDNHRLRVVAKNPRSK